MRQFLKKVLMFMLPIFLIVVSFEILLRNIPNDYKYKKSYLDKYSNSIDVLILGSSHSYYDINPDYLKFKSFNAGYVSQTLDIDYKILNKYNGEWLNLQYIVIPISYFSLLTNLKYGIESWRIKNYIIYYHLFAMMPKNITDYSELFSHTFTENKTRIISYYIKKQNSISCSEKGWGLDYNSKNKATDLLNSGKTAAKRHTQNDNLLQENLNTLISIIKYAKNKNIKVILFTPPAFHTYTENLDKGQLYKTISFVSYICSRYDNAYYFNLLTDKTFKEIEFFDADHLNEIGAEHLTKKIDSLISLVSTIVK